jgi:hypothetical protein
MWHVSNLHLFAVQWKIFSCIVGCLAVQLKLCVCVKELRLIVQALFEKVGSVPTDLIQS